jgi:replicative DNA helicase
MAEVEELGLIVIDYLQLMESSLRTDNVVQQVSEISRSLKGLAREFNVPVVALSQLSRSVESRSPQIPRLSDLRESGSIEQDADVVLFIYREERENPDTENKGIAEIHIAKQRNGPIGKIKLGFKKEYATFVNLDHRHQQNNE